MKLSRYTVAVERNETTTTLFNTYHQTFAHLATEMWDRLRSSEPLHRSAVGAAGELWTGLAEAGFLVDDGIDELEQVIVAQHHARRDESRLELTIAPTMACNLGCGYCTELHKRPTSMSLDDQDRVVEFVAGRLDGVKELQVCWFGGEPLVRPAPILRLSRKLISLCAFRGIAYRASVITNGTLLSDDLARELRSLQVRTARVTIDGPRDLHDSLRPTIGGKGSYDDVLHGVEVARRYFDTAIGVNVGKPNVRRVPELLHELARRELFDVAVFFSRIFDPAVGDDGPDMPRGRAVTLSVEEFAHHEVRLLRVARELGLSVSGFEGATPALPCSAVKADHFVLEPGGIVKRCYHEVTDDSKATGRLGRDGFLRLERDDVWMSHELLDDGCRQCAYLPMCHGGCPKFRMTGMDKEREICTPRKFNLTALISDEIW